MIHPFEVIRVPFPYSDLERFKKRPALVLSADYFNQQSRHVIIAMITSAKYSSFPSDVPIHYWEAAGLPLACLVRMKLFTIDMHKIIDRIGHLHHIDGKAVVTALHRLLPYHP